MLQLSIENISLKFDELHQLRANNWRPLDPPEQQVPVDTVWFGPFKTDACYSDSNWKLYDECEQARRKLLCQSLYNLQIQQPSHVKTKRLHCQKHFEGTFIFSRRRSGMDEGWMAEWLEHRAVTQVHGDSWVLRHKWAGPVEIFTSLPETQWHLTIHVINHTRSYTDGTTHNFQFGVKCLAQGHPGERSRGSTRSPAEARSATDELTEPHCSIRTQTLLILFSHYISLSLSQQVLNIAAALWLYCLNEVIRDIKVKHMSEWHKATAYGVTDFSFQTQVNHPEGAEGKSIVSLVTFVV